MLLTAKKILVDYCELRSRLLSAYTMHNTRIVPKFFIDADAVEILTCWDNDRCESLLRDLSTATATNGGDTTLNPWCIYNEQSCSDCQYKIRHGLCKDTASDYTLISKAIRKQNNGGCSNISSIPGFLDILSNFLETYLKEEQTIQTTQTVQCAMKAFEQRKRSWIRSVFL